jgi:hypothetical protein
MAPQWNAEGGYKMINNLINGEPLWWSETIINVAILICSIKWQSYKGVGICFKLLIEKADKKISLQFVHEYLICQKDI